MIEIMEPVRNEERVPKTRKKERLNTIQAFKRVSLTLNVLVAFEQ